MATRKSLAHPDPDAESAKTPQTSPASTPPRHESDQQGHELISGLTAPAFIPPESPCGPDERLAIFERAGIGREHWQELERIILDAPARSVGKGALDNVVGGLFSKKCLNVLPFESHTVERAFLYRLELDPDVISYRTQVRLPNVEGIGRDGRRYVTSAVTDVLVLTESGVSIVECKSLSWLEKEVKKKETQWSNINGQWTNTPLAAWAAQRGLQFEVFAQSAHFAIELQNLEFLYAISDLKLTTKDETIIRKAKDILSSGPKTVIDICAQVPGFNNRHTGQMLCRRLAFGMLRSQSICLEDHFLLFEQEGHALLADATVFNENSKALGPLDISRPILKATPHDVWIAQTRLAKIQAMRAGKGIVSGRTVRLAKILANGVASGLTEIEALLGETHKSGNRHPKLDKALPKIIAEVVEKHWVTGKVTDLDELLDRLEEACKPHGVKPCSKTTLRLAVNQTPSEKRALARGGMRAYQAVKPITPPDRRSLPPIAYGHTLHIDSSSLDNRSAPNLTTYFPAEKARFYIGVDGATGNPMAHALIFGPARTDGLAILMREYVARNGFLPALILIDRGTENTSKWFRQFCKEACINWEYSPTGGSRYNSQAENIIGRINSQFAHKLAGSTRPDQYGRAVDGKFKSSRNARIQFSVLAQGFTTFLYNDLANCPNDDNVSPQELALELRAFGEFCGKPASLDAAFLILTSVSTGTTPCIERGYVRTSDGKFSSIEFQNASKNVKRVDELKRDCVNPSVMYARIGTSWHQVFNRAVHTYGQVPDAEKLWMLLTRPINAAQSRATKLDAKSERSKRHKEINDAASAHESVAPPVGQTSGYVESAQAPEAPLDWESLDAFE